MLVEVTRSNQQSRDIYISEDFITMERKEDCSSNVSRYQPSAKNLANKTVPCNKCSLKAKLVDIYEGLVGNFVHQRGIYMCVAKHKQDRILSIRMSNKLTERAGNNTTDQQSPR